MDFVVVEKCTSLIAWCCGKQGIQRMGMNKTLSWSTVLFSTFPHSLKYISLTHGKETLSLPSRETLGTRSVGSWK